MKKITILSFLTIVFLNGYSQKDSIIQHSLGLSTGSFFYDYGIIYTNRLTPKNAISYKLFFSTGNYFGDELFGVKGGAFTTDYMYIRKPKKNYSYWNLGVKYRYITVDSVFWDDNGFNQYSYTLNSSNQISLRVGWGYQLNISKVYLNLLLGMEETYFINDVTNHYRIPYEDNEAPIHLNSYLEKKFIIMPIIDFSIGYKF